MLELRIGNKDYKIEYTIEASLYKDCTEQITTLMSEMFSPEENKGIKDVISTMTNIPQTTLTMFYAGLLENHGEDGDGSVQSISDAKKLIKQYMSEHKDDETGNFFGVMKLLIEQMGEDGFFKQIGLEQVAEVPTKEVKKPQDHKKKATKLTEN